MPKKESSASGLGCLFLFALPFAAVGVVMAYLTAAAVVEWASMQSWVEVEAHIDSVALQQNHDSDSTTYEVTASYRYTFEGRDYQGTRVGIHSGSDNIGDYHEATYAALSDYRGRTFRCFVDPDAPSHAILDRDLRWGLLGFYMLFVVLFGGAGFGLMAAGVYGAKKQKREQALAAQHPNEPWLQNEDWADGRIRSSTKAAFIGAAIFAGVWNVISMPVVIFARDQIFDPANRVALIALVFPVVGVGLAVWAARSFARWRKFGESVLELSTVPGVIGGPLEGTIRTSTEVRPESGFDVTLSSIHHYRTGSGKNRSSHEKVLWQKSYRVGLDRSTQGIPIAFHIPYECEPTDGDDSDNRHLWKVEISAAVLGVDYHAEFEVPVFRTEHSSELAPPPSEVANAPARVDVSLAERLARGGARVELLPMGKRFVFPMARYKANVVGLTVFFAVWSAIVYFLWHSDAPRLFPWVFGFFDVLLLFGVLDVWFYSSTIEASPGRLRIAAGLFGGRRRELSRAEIVSVTPKRGMQSGDKLYYQLEVQERDGKTRIAAKRLPDLETAEQLAGEIESILS